MRLPSWAGLAAAFRRWRARGTDPRGSALPPLPAGTAERFTFLTSAYDTRPDFLRELAATIAAQDAPGARWIVVDNGSRDEATRACLRELALRPGVRLERVEQNLGILGGMRRALELAATDFVIPVDSDDLLAPHTIRAVGHALLAGADARFVFSDEDHFTDGVRCNPFHRVGWDPALALACSYVWHLVAFGRAEALQLGVYGDPGANYCHDWDTLLRFVRAGHTPRHVREVLYSWRTHPQSTTNNAADAHHGSLASQRHVLALHLAERGLGDRFTVADCPLWRGAPELRLERRPGRLPAIDVLVVGEGPVAAAWLDELLATVAAAAPLGRRLTWLPPGVAAPAGWTAVANVDALADGAAGALLVCDAGSRVREGDALHELAGWFELLPDAVVVGGRSVDAHGRVLSAGEFPHHDGALRAPDAGRRSDDAGPFAMALKPRCVAVVPDGRVLVRGDWLTAAAAALRGRPVTAATAVAWLCAAAARTRHHAVCTPFVTVTPAADRRRGPATAGALQQALQQLAGGGFAAFAPAGVWQHASGAP
jgi:hypothetical protein